MCSIMAKFLIKKTMAQPSTECGKKSEGDILYRIIPVQGEEISIKNDMQQTKMKSEITGGSQGDHRME